MLSNNSPQIYKSNCIKTTVLESHLTDDSDRLTMKVLESHLTRDCAAELFLSPKGHPSSFLIFCSKLKFQKAQRVSPLIFEKKRKMRILKQSHSAEKVERGDPLGFLKLQFAAKYQKTQPSISRRLYTFPSCYCFIRLYHTQFNLICRLMI